MNLICPQDLNVSRPFQRGLGPSEIGPRMGGRPPKGIYPSSLCVEPRYLLTLPLSEDRQSEITIFYSWDQFNKLIGVPNNSIEKSIGKYIDIAIHGHSFRDIASPFTSDLSEHPVIISDPVNDLVIDDEIDEAPLSDHKIGGRPCRIRNLEQLFKNVASIQAQGYLQVVQLEFIGSNDVEWKGNWPFADGVFHLFGKPPFGEHNWCWIWQY